MPEDSTQHSPTTGSTTLRLQVVVDTDDLRHWAEKHSDAGHHGVAAVLFDAAKSLNSQSIDLADLTKATERVRALHSTDPRAETCRECAQTIPCQTIRTLDDAEVYHRRGDLAAMMTAVRYALAEGRATEMSAAQLSANVTSALNQRADLSDAPDNSPFSDAAIAERSELLARARYCRDRGNYYGLTRELHEALETLHAALAEQPAPEQPSTTPTGTEAHASGDTSAEVRTR